MRFAVLCGIALFAPFAAVCADGPTFEAASVTLSGPDIRPPFGMTGGPGTSDPSRFRVPRIAMLGLLAKAFDVQTDQISGPAWLRGSGTANTYSIVATMHPDITNEQFHKMLQNLLAERFHMVFHRETRNFPGYALVVDKGGPKLKEVIPTDAPTDTSASLPNLVKPRGTDGFPILPPGSRTTTLVGRGGQSRTKYQERTMAEFASKLGFEIGSSQGRGALEGLPQPRVIDKTGLTGKYTFILEYYDAGMSNLVRNLPLPRGNPGNADGTIPAASEPDGGLPNIFDAVRKQLGLRLDKIPDVPLDMIVVESIDKVPTPN